MPATGLENGCVGNVGVKAWWLFVVQSRHLISYMEANVLGSLMQNGIGSAVTVPGAVSLLLFFVFSYLYSQSRANYFRAWQIGWAAFSAHYALDTWMLLRRPSAVGFFVSQLLLFGMAFCVFVSTRLTRKGFRWEWYDGVVAGAGTVL